MFKVLPIHRRTLDRLLHVDRVFWMNAFENKFHRRFRRSVILEDPRGFLGPADLTGRNAPAEAAGATYSLGLMQRGLAPAQAIFAALQSRVEIVQAPGCVVEYLPEVSEFVSPGNRHLMLKLAPRQCLGAFHQSRQWLRDAAGYGKAEGSGNQQCQNGGQRYNPKN